MTTKEPEPKRFLDIPVISEKTPNEKLQEWSKQHWLSDRRKSVACDIVNNGKELLLGSNVDWDLVLRSISVVGGYNSSMHFGEAAIAADGSRFIGGLAARSGWSMHNPETVCLSGKYLGHIASSKLEDFKTTMTLASVSYIHKILPEAELLIKTMDLLLENPDIRNRSNLLTKMGILLQDRKIQDAYTLVSSREDFVRRRG